MFVTPVLTRAERARIDADVALAVDRLGDAGEAPVPAGVLQHLHDRVGRAAWMLADTEIRTADGVLPETVPLRDAYRALGALLRTFGLERVIGLAAPIRQVGGVTGALLSDYAPTLGAAIAALPAAGDLAEAQAEPAFGREGEARVLAWRVPPGSGALGALLAVLRAAKVYRCIEAHAPGPLGDVVLEFAAPAPQRRESFGPLASCALRFDRPSDRIVYPAAWDEAANPHFDSALWQMGLRRRRASRLAVQDAGVMARVRQIVARALADGGRPPLLADVAAALGKSVRSLERALSQQDATFRGVVEAERRNLAAELLADPTRSIEEIAVLLGFSDRTSFSRAFRAWHHVPPAEFRRDLMA